MVLRVSRMRQPVPATASAYWRASGGHAAQALQEVERDALASSSSAGGAADGRR